MRKIEQVNELSALLLDMHGVEISPVELLELDDYNYALAAKQSSALAPNDLSEITYDIGKAIGFIVGAVLGAFILPGLGFGITGWFAGAVAGGALGYRLVSLFDGSGAPGQRTDVTDSSTRFSGVGQLGQLGAEIPIIYGNKDINIDGGVIVRDPTTIYSRISTGGGVQYIERLSLLTVGEVGRVALGKTLFNDQVAPELNNSIEVSSGKAIQPALGKINHYSQAVALSSNNNIGLRRVLTIKDLGAARGAANSATNLVNVTGTGTATISKTSGTSAWDSGFASAIIAADQLFGSYVFSRSTMGGTTPRLAVGFTYPTNLNLTNPETMDMAYEVDCATGNWTLWESTSQVRASGNSPLIVSGAIIEVRIYYHGLSICWVQLIIGTTEIDRTLITFALTGLSIHPDFAFYSPGASLASRTAGLVAKLVTAGNVTPGLGTRFTVELASLSKVFVGKIYAGGSENFTIVNIDTPGLFIEVSPSLWISDIVVNSTIGATVNALGSISEGFTGVYTTSQKVQSVELLLNYVIFGKTSANAASLYAQAFVLRMRKSETIPWVTIGTYMLQGDTEAAKTVTIAVTNLPDDVYDIKIEPIDSQAVATTVDVLQLGQVSLATGSIPINSGTASTIIERLETLTILQAQTRLDLQPTVQSSERGASIQLSHVNEIANPFGILSGTPSSVPVGTGTGLDGYYYSIKADNTINALLGTRLDTIPTYTQTQAAPFPGWNANRCAIIWVGVITPRYTATYTFEINHDDGCVLVINDRRLITSATVGTADTASISLTAGVEYSIQLDYYNTGGIGILQLRWSAPQFPKELVPVQQLKPGVPAFSAEPPAPTYPGFTITRTKLVSSDRLSSAPNESYDVELGAIIRQYLANGIATTANSTGTIADNRAPFSTIELAIGDRIQVLGEGTMVITATPTNTTIVCTQYTGTCFPVTNDSLIVLDNALWVNTNVGMTFVALGAPSGTIVNEILLNNRVRLTDMWGREVKVTLVGTPSTVAVTINQSKSVAIGDTFVVYRMGSSNYFPDCYVDRLINPVSGLGLYISEDQFIDYPSIVAARRWCKVNNFYFDGRVGGGTFESWAIQTAPASLLFATEIRGRYGLLIQDDGRPTYLFNDSNCDYAEPGIPSEGQLTNTLLVGYQDRGGRAKQLKVQTTAASTGAEVEVVKTISAPGATSRNQVIKVGQVALKSLRLQSSTCTITTDIAVGLYCQQGDIVRTQHRAIEYADELSGFVLSIAAPTNSRTTSRAVAIDKIEGYQLTSLTRLQLTPDPANPRRTTDGLAITGHSQGSSNVTLVNSAVAILDDYRLSATALFAQGTGGTLTISRTVIDQVVTLSEPVTVDANSRFICTSRVTRATESDLLVQQVTSNSIRVIGLGRALEVGDVWAVGSQSTFYKKWRISSMLPDVQSNKVTFTGVTWNADILSPTGLVTI